MLIESSRRPELPIAPDRQDRNAAATIVRFRHPLAAIIEAEMARPYSTRLDLVQLGELARLPINRKSAYGIYRLALIIVHRVEEPMIRALRQKRWIRALPSQPDRCQLAG